MDPRHSTKPGWCHHRPTYQLLVVLQVICLISSSNGWTATSHFRICPLTLNNHHHCWPRCGQNQRAAHSMRNSHLPFLADLRGGGKEGPSFMSMSKDNDDQGTTTPESEPFEYCAEVIGGMGRIGSFWLCYGKSKIYSSSSSTSIPAIVARGIAPGSQTKPGCPIYVATPSGDTWEQIYQDTLPERRSDLVWLGNGIVPQHFRDTTVCIPHYSILQICNTKTASAEKMIGTSPISPPTYIYGKHANTAARILREHGVKTEIVASFDEIQLAAAKKLLWASCLWLFVHKTSQPCTVEQVHELYPEELERLIEELLPALQAWMSAIKSTHISESAEGVGHDDAVAHQAITKHDLLNYLEDYSRSIAGAITSKKLALAEIMDRNGFWLQYRGDDTVSGKTDLQSYHLELLTNMAGKERVDALLEEVDAGRGRKPKIQTRRIVKLPGTKLAVSAQRSITPDAQDRPIKDIVIVGGGIIGSSVALQLARSYASSDLPTPAITVVDILPDHCSTSNGDDASQKADESEKAEECFGRTTPASWAWLNANAKLPKQYQWLNQWGLQLWKDDSMLSGLPIWSGSLVRFSGSPSALPTFLVDGGYPVEGPLSPDRLKELEPLANWAELDESNASVKSNDVYYFPDEGSVDPVCAVQTCRQAAKDLGVTFLGQHNVTQILRDASGTVRGLSCQRMIRGLKDGDAGAGESNQVEIPADLVVVAAGVGAATKALGGLPLIHRPGSIAYATPKLTSSDNTNSNRLSRILVDPLRETHVLQRRDGTIVAGGGALEVGGSSILAKEEYPGTVLSATTSSLSEAAARLAPSVIEQAGWTHIEQADRPMPLDGLPIIGYLDEPDSQIEDNSVTKIHNTENSRYKADIYAVITHSGMTLGPLLGALAAVEIVEEMEIDILKRYRPSRFNQDGSMTATI